MSGCRTAIGSGPPRGLRGTQAESFSFRISTFLSVSRGPVRPPTDRTARRLLDGGGRPGRQPRFQVAASSAESPALSDTPAPKKGTTSSGGRMSLRTLSFPRSTSRASATTGGDATSERHLEQSRQHSTIRECGDLLLSHRRVCRRREALPSAIRDRVRTKPRSGNRSRRRSLAGSSRLPRSAPPSKHPRQDLRPGMADR